MDSAFAFVLRRQAWDYFATLTFKSSRLHWSKSASPVFAWLRMLAECKRLHFRSVFWVWRFELGELNGRPHFHVLVAGIPDERMSASDCGFFKRVWENQLGVGIADVRPWDGRDAAGYLVKGFSSVDGERIGGNGYESGKFGASDLDRLDRRTCEVSHSFRDRWESLLSVRMGLNRESGDSAADNRGGKFCSENGSIMESKTVKQVIIQPVPTLVRS